MTLLNVHILGPPAAGRRHDPNQGLDPGHDLFLVRHPSPIFRIVIKEVLETAEDRQGIAAPAAYRAMASSKSWRLRGPSDFW